MKCAKKGKKCLWGWPETIKLLRCHFAKRGSLRVSAPQAWAKYWSRTQRHLLWMIAFHTIHYLGVRASTSKRCTLGANVLCISFHNHMSMLPSLRAVDRGSPICACMHVCAHMFAPPVHAHVHTHAHTHAHTQVHSHVYTRVYTHDPVYAGEGPKQLWPK